MPHVAASIVSLVCHIISVTAAVPVVRGLFWMLC